MPTHSHAQQPHQPQPQPKRSVPAAPVAGRTPEPVLPSATRQVLPEDPVLSRQLAAAVRERAGAAALQRKVKLGSKPWLKKLAKLPAIPAALAANYQPYVIEQAKTRAAAWRDDDDVTNRDFLTEQPFYQAVFEDVLTRGRVDAPSGGDLWNKLKVAAETAGNVTEVPWSSLGLNGPILQTELMNCEVQVSSNTSTTACHGNTHNKLPKKVNPPVGQTLAALAPSLQPNFTPYIEFLIPGHKTTTGIERGILDRTSGLIYLTAHYTKGSFVWLSSAPPALVANWQAKATTYVAGL